MKKQICIVLLAFITIHFFSQSRPTQNGYEHSKKTMEIMGITRNSSISQVKKQLNDWSIVWEPTKFNNGIQIRNLNWVGITFDWVNIMFDYNGKIKYITCFPSEFENPNKIMDAFKKICVGLPFRRKMQSPINSTQMYEIYNGQNETEFALFAYHPYPYDALIRFTFYFNGSIQECEGLNP